MHYSNLGLLHFLLPSRLFFVYICETGDNFPQLGFLGYAKGGDLKLNDHHKWRIYRQATTFVKSSAVVLQWELNITAHRRYEGKWVCEELSTFATAPIIHHDRLANILPSRRGVIYWRDKRTMIARYVFVCLLCFLLLTRSPLKQAQEKINELRPI